MTNFEHFLTNYLLRFELELTIRIDKDSREIQVYSLENRIDNTYDIDAINRCTLSDYLYEYTNPFVDMVHDMCVKEKPFHHDSAEIKRLLKLIHSDKVTNINGSIDVLFMLQKSVSLYHYYMVNGEKETAFRDVIVDNDPNGLVSLNDRFELYLNIEIQ